MSPTISFKENKDSARIAFVILALICCLTLLPFLGLADFNTKGEPREAVVAYSILEQDNWILPTNNGGEIPYKPPFFHWCIAAASLLNGGVVNEYTSRLPSAVALIAMTLATFTFFRRRSGTETGLLAALTAFTSLELYRSGMNCRVDMVLTALSVGAIFCIAGRYLRGRNGIPWLAVLLMSAATLTKGPVGIVVPCLVCGIFMLLRGTPFFAAFIRLCFWGALSLIIPALWYAAAIHQGGQEFIDLVLEENFGRMTNTMSYDSCVHPWTYNVGVLLGGFIPWTIAAALALFAVKFHKPTAERLREGWKRFRAWLRGGDAMAVLSFTAATVIFIFYCIPQSKRSVYLMPMYPFLGYFMARLLLWLTERKPAIPRLMADLLASIGVIAFLIFVALKFVTLPESLFGHGRHALQNMEMARALAEADSFGAWLCAAVSPLAALVWWLKARLIAKGFLLAVAPALIMVAIYISLGGAYQPAVLNVKSVKPVARDIESRYPEMPGRMYEYIAGAETAAGDPLHQFELNFYLGDRIRNFRRERPREGYLVISEEDAAKDLPRFEQEGYRFRRVYTPLRPLNKQPSAIYAFTR